MQRFCVSILVFLAAYLTAAHAGCENNPDFIKISQADFTTGTYLITAPGKYCLIEDVTFNPNSLDYIRGNVDPNAQPYDTSDVLPSQFTVMGGPYDPSAFGIGFFAAIAIAADGVVLNLNGHLLEQSEEHALQQRFYANIELADRPFISGQGPHSFGTLNAAKNVVIKNGKLGRSSHHGIHGNDNENVEIKDLVINDWEVAAIALNHVQGLHVTRVSAASRRDLPVMGRFSIGRFLRPYINCMVDNGAPFTLTVQGEAKTAADIKKELRQALNRVFKDIVKRDLDFIDASKHPEEYALFHNKFGVVDGNAYGFLINSRGVAVNSFPSLPLTVDSSADVVFEDVTLKRVEGNIDEVVALAATSKKGGQIDAVGAVFQIFNRHPDTDELLTISSEDKSQAEYLGNAVSNAQALVAKAVLAGWFDPSLSGCRANLDVSRLSITQDTIDWIEATPGTEDAKLSKLEENLGAPALFCNADTMFHVNKGVIGFKMDGAAKLTMSKCTANKVINFGQPGATICDYDTTEKSMPLAFLSGYNGADSRGFSFAGSKKVTVKKCTVKKVISDWGSAIGFDYFGNSKRATNKKSTVKKAIAGRKADGDKSYFTGPNRVPLAACQRIKDGSSQVVVRKDKCKLVSGISPSKLGTSFVDSVFDTIIN